MNVKGNRQTPSPKTGTRANKSDGWSTPHGRSANKTMRDATDRVIGRYSDALKQLKKHG